jgi:hypothetical protein
MTQQEIDKAATDSCVIENSIFNPSLIPYYEQGFKDGSKWRINSVWNDVKEIPQKSFAILAIRKDGSVEKVFFMNTLRWKNLIKRCGFVKWAYVKDLIPDKEE